MELIIAVAIIGLLAAVAVPAFGRYLRRSKTTEATMNLRRLFDATVAYYALDRSDGNGNLLVKQFPLETAAGGGSGWAPAQGACCAQPGQKCAPAANVGLWSQDTWAALNFSVDDPFYYSYRTVGSGGAAIGDRYNLEASGDLNCDGVYSLYRRSAAIDSSYAVSGTAAVYATDAVE